jgi:hypothetical protein
MGMKVRRVWAGDESAQSLGISPASLASSSGSGGGGGGGGCFIDTAGGSVPGLLSIMLELLTIGVVITLWLTVRGARRKANQLGLSNED